MKLSIGMIVKNEEKYLEKCLTALKPVLEQVDSELIIADTGSTDRTVEIAKKFTDNVFYFEWINDFAAARNATLDRAKGEWYMFIDADEIARDCSDIIRFFNSGEYKKYGTATCVIRSFSDSVNREDYMDAVLSRLTAKKAGVRFGNPIHEQLYPVFMPVKSLDLIFDHYGYVWYDDGVPNGFAREKAERNLQMMLKELEEAEAAGYVRPYLCKQIADSCGAVNDREEALKYVKKGMSLLDPKDPANLTYYALLVRTLFLLKRYDELSEACGNYFSKENLARPEINQMDSFIHLIRASMYYDTWDYEKALSDYYCFFDVYDKKINNRLKITYTRFGDDYVKMINIKNAGEHVYHCARATGNYEKAEDVLRKFPYLPEIVSDPDFMRRYITQRLEIMEHTDFSDLPGMYNKLDDSNKKLCINIVTWHLFKTGRSEQLCDTLKKTAKGSEGFEALVSIYAHCFVMKDLTPEDVREYILNYGVTGSETVLCIMLMSGFDIAPFISADEFDPSNCVRAIFRNLSTAAKLFTDYDINAISPQYLQKAAAVYEYAMLGAHHNNVNVVPLFDKFGEIGAKWVDAFPDHTPQGDIKAATRAHSAAFGRKSGNLGLCDSELSRMVKTYPALEPMISAYRLAIFGESEPAPVQTFTFSLKDQFEKALKEQEPSKAAAKVDKAPDTAALNAEFEKFYPNAEPEKSSETPQEPESEFQKLAEQFKQNIRGMLNVGNIERAQSLIGDYEKLCPNDPDLIELKKRMTSHKPEPKSEFEMLAEQLKQNIRRMSEAGDTAQARALIAEYEQLCPNDPELGELKERASD